MVLEQDATGVASNRALDRSFVGDSVDPVLLHIALNKPTDPATAQLLWASTDGPLTWVRFAENKDFHFVEHAVLPPGSMIEYRVYVHRYNIEIEVLRHQRDASSSDIGLILPILNVLYPFEYVLQARLIVPGRPVQIVNQRVDIVAPPDTPDPTPDPNTNPKPVPDPDPKDNPPVPPVAAGFTKLTKSVDTNIIYVSNSQGNDANDGLTPQTPVKTLARGVSMVRKNTPDWLLLKAGDTWLNESFKDINFSGSSSDKPTVIGVYGEGKRPIIIPPHGEHGLKTINHEIRGLVIQGLHFYGATRDPASNLYKGRPGDVDGINIRIAAGDGKFIKGLVIEDCVVTHFDSNIKLVDDWSRKQGEGVPGRIEAIVRRNIIRYASGQDSHSIGIYLEGTSNTIIEQNLIDHNGWAQTDGFEVRNKASHNIYAQWANGPITVRHNYITRGAAHGLQLRAGGNIEHNLFVRNAMAFFASMGDSKANYNVILESDDMNPDVPAERRGYGINGWDMGSYEVIGNVIARRVGQLEKPGIDVSADKLVIKDNTVYDWQDSRTNSSIVYFKGTSATVSGNKAKELNGGKEPNFVDPLRGLNTYAGTIGLEPTLEAFLDFLTVRPRGTWEEKIAPETVANYIRDGFKLKN